MGSPSKNKMKFILLLSYLSLVASKTLQIKEDEKARSLYLAIEDLLIRTIKDDPKIFLGDSITENSYAMDGSFFYKHIVDEDAAGSVKDKVAEIMKQRWPDMSKTKKQTVFVMKQTSASNLGREVGNKILRNFQKQFNSGISTVDEDSEIFRDSEGYEMSVNEIADDREWVKYVYERKDGQLNDANPIMDAPLPLLIRSPDSTYVEFEVLYNNRSYKWNLARAHHLPGDDS